MTWKFGHRGACGHAPENTLVSMRKAIEFGVDGFEFDIQMSKDGEPVVIHDETLERTTSGTGAVNEHTLKELQELDAAKGQYPGETIPSLRDVLDMVDKRCKLLIELKSEYATVPVADILAHYIEHKGWSYEQLYLCSFDHLQLAAVHTIDHRFRTCALLVGIPVSLAAIAEEASAWALNPAIHNISQTLVDDAHRRHLKVMTWTCNDPRHIARARALGVDGIISDYPDRL